MARMDRPADWTPDWSAQSVAQQKEALASFEKRWKEMDAGRWAIPRQVDYRLIGSALSRAGWELYVTRNWQRNPAFYVDQSLGAVYERLLQPPRHLGHLSAIMGYSEAYDFAFDLLQRTDVARGVEKRELGVERARE